jgi:hypothetical protein
MKSESETRSRLGGNEMAQSGLAIGEKAPGESGKKRAAQCFSSKMRWCAV